MTIEEEEVLLESPKYKKENIFGKDEIKKRYLENKEEFIIEYASFEFLLLDMFEGNRKLLSSLKDNLINIFEREEKYSFDLVVSYLLKNGVDLEEEIEILLEDNKKLSFVTREKLLSLEEKEIEYCKDDKVFEKIYGIMDIAQAIESEKGTKKIKND